MKEKFFYNGKNIDRFYDLPQKDDIVDGKSVYWTKFKNSLSLDHTPCLYDMCLIDDDGTESIVLICVHLHRISTDNGLTLQYVDDMTDDEIDNVLQSVKWSDFPVSDNVNGDTDRVWLENFIIDYGQDLIIS